MAVFRRSELDTVTSSQKSSESGNLEKELVAWSPRSRGTNAEPTRTPLPHRHYASFPPLLLLRLRHLHRTFSRLDLRAGKGKILRNSLLVIISLDRTELG